MRTRLLRISITLLSIVCLALSQTPSAGDPAKPDPTKPDPTKETEAGIPVTDKLTIAKCSGCHTPDSNSNLSRISWIRTTPEGWQESIKRMVQLNGLQLGPEDARQIVRYLANEHGLAPEEAQPERWYLEMTQIQAETLPSPGIRRACTTCHPFARPQTWRRSAAEWHLLKNMHIGYFPLSQFVAFQDHSPAAAHQDPNAPKPKEPVDEAVDYLSKNDGLYSSSWSNWRAQMTDTDLSGHWLLSAAEPGKGKYFGEMTVTRVAPGEFKTEADLTGVDGTKLQLPGRSFLYTGYEWRGSTSSSGIGNIRQVMTLSSDQSTLQGRWFWGAYQEFGLTVTGQREGPATTVLGTDVISIQAGTKGVPMRIYGQHLPADLKPADFDLGAGVKVAKVVSIDSKMANVTVDVDPKVFAGRRKIGVRGYAATDAFSVYDHIEYIKITAETALAHVGGTVGKKGYVQYEAHAFANGGDGLPNTADDVDLGPIKAQWSIEEFISHNNDNDKEFVGFIDPTGLFTPGQDGPNPQRRLSMDNIGDVWVVAKYSGPGAAKPPLEAKSYLVVGIPDFLRFDSPEVGGSK